MPLPRVKSIVILIPILLMASGAVCASAPLQNQTAEAAAAPPGFKMPRLNTEPTEVEVIGGEISTDRRIVGISYDDNAGVTRVCSGLWISRDFVLTAAHCTCNNSSGIYAVTNANEIEKIGAAQNSTAGSMTHSASPDSRETATISPC